MPGGVAGPFAEFVEQPGGEVLERSADSMLAGKGDSQPGGEQGAEEGRGHRLGISWGRGWSVPAGQFGEVYGQPAVVREVVELDLAEKARGDRRGCEPPSPGVSAEFEPGE